MPELPEMETYKLLLTQKIGGKTITGVTINRDKSINVKPEVFQQHVQNQKVTSIERRAKYILFHLNSGSTLLLHLMLGGWMFYGTADEKPDHTVQVQLSFGDDHLYFIGLRLGYLHLVSAEALQEELNDLGPEPLDVNFSLNDFQALVKGRRGKLKTTLIDQDFLSGIGNRYSDEIAWHARLLPTRTMDELSSDEQLQLYQSIRFILQQAITYGGAADEPFFQEDTKTGGYIGNEYVYNREGEACKRCGAEIRKDEISSRKSFYCTQCQQ
ncbi:bifunctional DNA-formamidopyrimidine glycosylase/DNA-(apurinic or apyrimidinic site) lyase [Virgibacillus siamensis]|uniref:bifunctional DNA-formamidopyrimidine glycosylase/DNA-(apurinic or apyrimidinic site) lyase n=1 Tax=Virgibacillus siamensis TaxID=480071 RepID=UPI0009861350|nr:bifunctional DNA-formamidopyrimidine glycosylase/DNA-(apurinic or apyrimidinic site) lyase [Virgibacillus siamensis]